MDGASATNFVAGSLVAHKTQQLQHLGHRHQRTHFFKAHTWHGSNHHDSAAIVSENGAEKRSP